MTAADRPPLYTAEQRDSYLAEIETAAADKPPHARYFADLVAHYSGGGTDDDEPHAPRGVSWKVECALSADVAAIHANAPELGHGGGYTRDYIRIRQADKLIKARTRADRAKAQAAQDAADDANPLGSLLGLGPDTDA